MVNDRDVHRLRAMKAAVSYAVKHTVVADDALGKIAAGAVRGALVSARQLGWADPAGIVATMTGVMQSSGQILDAIALDESTFVKALSKISSAAMAMALAENAEPVHAAEGAVIGAMAGVTGSETDLVERICAVTRGLVMGAAKVDATVVGAVASGACKGAVERPMASGCGAAVVAYAVAKAAFAAAGEIGLDAQRQVREALATQIDDREGVSREPE